MAEIKVLPQNIADKIAAGEVAERPSAVVKELVENSIDAGADSIQVEIENGGVKCIRVTDNGCGIHSSQVETAFLRHATSKLRDIEDLYSMSTMGFRGEALSSICAVANVRIITRSKDEEEGTLMELSHGIPSPKESIACNVGTIMEVSDLFENINDISDCDMYFSPYGYEHWGGSTEGLVNISYLTGSSGTDYYLTNYKINQLESDYYFSYLLLLNQRFAAIRYINEIAMAEDSSSRDIEALSHKIVRLKTIFSFKVISDDRIYQNIYARMYKILDIDCLIEDIKDNENQMELIWNNAVVKREQLVTALLFVLSVLSVFSTLIDASSYFDRFGFINHVSSYLSLVITIVAILTVVVVTLIRRKK